jgi:hypothetical protein
MGVVKGYNQTTGFLRKIHLQLTNGALVNFKKISKKILWNWRVSKDLSHPPNKSIMIWKLFESLSTQVNWMDEIWMDPDFGFKLWAHPHIIYSKAFARNNCSTFSMKKTPFCGWAWIFSDWLIILNKTYYFLKV